MRSSCNRTPFCLLPPLQGCWWWLSQRTLLVNHSLEDEGVGDSARTHTVDFDEDFKLQDVVEHQGANSPQKGLGATVTGLRTGRLASIDW